ncbi:MAG TPA: AsmA-like C-terminal region-containing protein, partial [Candidatus Acidoferrales bacterium]|nr:AsmA-like C-terminal region-containing protein [Candidatus Acidoferrales bacterium]
NVADQLEVRGSTSLNFTLSGWPPRIERGEIASAGAEADGGSTPVQIHLEKASATFLPNSVTLQPVVFSVGAGSGAFRLQASLSRKSQWHSLWKLDGSTPEVRSLFAAADALGFNLPPGWMLDGPVDCNLQWAGDIWPALHQPSGTLTLAGLKIHAPFLNRDITHVKASVELSPQGDKVQLTSANAFAADWHGTFQRSAPSAEWSFALSANQLSASEMDRWLNPQHRENLIDRILPFLASQPPPQPTPPWLRAHGTLSIGQFALSSFQFHQLRTDASVEGRHLKLSSAQAGFYGGTLSGSMALNLTQQPSYDIVAQFRDVNLGLVAAHTFSLSDLFTGAASGSLHLTAEGLGRDALLRSLSCDGQAQAHSVSYNGMDLLESMRAGERRPGITTVPRASTEFSCANGRVNFTRLQLLIPNGDVAATGDLDFQQHTGIHFLLVTAVPTTTPVLETSQRAAFYHLTGSLNAPDLVRVAARTTANP